MKSGTKAIFWASSLALPCLTYPGPRFYHSSRGWSKVKMDILVRQVGRVVVGRWPLGFFYRDATPPISKIDCIYSCICTLVWKVNYDQTSGNKRTGDEGVCVGVWCGWVHCTHTRIYILHIATNLHHHQQLNTPMLHGFTVPPLLFFSSGKKTTHTLQTMVFSFSRSFPV